MDSKFDQLSALVSLSKTDYAKFASGTKVCATRCRQHLQSIVKTCAELRKSILDESKAMTKPKAEKENIPPIEELPPPEPLKRTMTDAPTPVQAEQKNEVVKATPTVAKPTPRQRRARKPASRS